MNTTTNIVNEDIVTVRAPGTTANLGPAFDVIGMALNCWLTVTVDRTVSEFSVEYTGDGKEEVPLTKDNLVVMSCETAYKDAGKPVPPLKYTISNDIPFGCGVGSSSAATVAGYMAGMRLCEITLQSRGTREELLSRMVVLEGHPDNASAALYGGMQVCYTRNAEKPDKTGKTDKETNDKQENAAPPKAAPNPMTVRVDVPSVLYAVLFTPAARMKKNTHATRGLLPTTVPVADAVHNMSRTTLVVLAMSTNRLDLLSDCLDERFHQDKRFDALFPHGRPVIEAAMKSGACYAFLSGAGPTMCALVEGKTTDFMCQLPEERLAGRVAQAMVKAATEAGVPGKCVVTSPGSRGAHYVGVTRVADGVFATE